MDSVKHHPLLPSLDQLLLHLLFLGMILQRVRRKARDRHRTPKLPDLGVDGRTSVSHTFSLLSLGLGLGIFIHIRILACKAPTPAAIIRFERAAYKLCGAWLTRDGTAEVNDAAGNEDRPEMLECHLAVGEEVGNSIEGGTIFC